MKSCLFFFLACGQLLDEAQVTLSFQDWLASVTERIHQTMHYQFDGKYWSSNCAVAESQRN